MPALCAAFLLFLILPSAPSGVTFEKGDGRIEILIDGKPFTTYYHAPGQFKPYFYPLRAADGRIITRHFPMVPNSPGEEKDRDHPHQRSLWFTFGDVDGVDYWAESAKLQGRIVQRSIDKMEGGQKKGVLAVTMDWIDNTGKKVLVQKQTVVIHADANRRIMDFTVTFTPVDHDVTFRDTKEGMFGIRLATPLKEQNGGVISNAKGGVTEKQCWGKKAEWVDYSGTLEGSKVGVTMMDHPKNLRHPTTWHVRSYGLFAVNPFGLRDFTGDKTQDGSHVVKTGSDLTFRYRILIHPGDAAEARLAEAYQQFTHEVK